MDMPVDFTVDDLHQAARDHLAIAERSTGDTYRWHRNIAEGYRYAISVWDRHPDTTADVAEAVRLLRLAAGHTPADRDDPDLPMLANQHLYAAATAAQARS